MRPLTIYIFLLALCISNAFAQQPVWKREVKRFVSFQDNAEVKLFDLIMSAVKNKNIPTFIYPNATSTELKYTSAQLENVLHPKPNEVNYATEFTSDSVIGYTLLVLVCNEDEIEMRLQRITSNSNSNFHQPLFTTYIIMCTAK